MALSIGPPSPQIAPAHNRGKNRLRRSAAIVHSSVPMPVLQFSATYRPIRIGWCIRPGQFEDLRRAVRLSHTLWGGRFNPLLPIGDREKAEHLASLFRVDALWPVADDPDVQNFVDGVHHLPWPVLGEELFAEIGGQRTCQILDVLHPLLQLEEDRRRNLLDPDSAAVVVRWDPADPLADILLTTVGAFPSEEDVGRDYGATIESRPGNERVEMDSGDAIPLLSVDRFTPSRLTTFNLRPRGRLLSSNLGLYVGNVGDFDDLLNYWNLRAAGLSLLFFDFTHTARLLPWIEFARRERRETLSEMGDTEAEMIDVWSTSRSIQEEVSRSIPGANTWYHVSEHTWNGLNLRPTAMTFERSSAIATVEDEGGTAAAVLSLPEKPTFADLRPQHYIVSLSELPHLIPSLESRTFTPPFVPELNLYYGAELHGGYNTVRAEPGSVGIVTTDLDSHLSLRALDHEQVIIELLKTRGISASVSDAGLVGRRLIQQMGGIQSCKVFKIAGVRKLIREHSPESSFTRSAALQCIGEVDAGKPNFSRYAKLYLEPPTVRKPSPDSAFLYLLRKRVFIAGLEFKCPHCELVMWVTLDDAVADMKCTFCGARFDVSPQLRDRDWRYRRSGLFGRSDSQKGAIPVSLTLQQLKSCFGPNSGAVYATSLDLVWGTNREHKCETDFVLVVRDQDERTAVMIGECKDAGPIEEGDARNLLSVAEQLRTIHVDPYIVFAKTSEFSSPEINVCREASRQLSERIIMFSARELESTRLPERSSDLPPGLAHPNTPFALAKLTEYLYLRED